MSKYKVCDGNTACADIAYMFSEICSIYPITPSSPMASRIDYLITNNTKNIFNDKVKLIEMQSEAGAAGTLHGALISGSLASTFTSSQGLLLMIPNMYKIAGEMLPGVIHCASRTIATHALSIFGDHSDIYAARSTNFNILSSSNVYDAQNLAIVAHLSAIEGSLPFLHFFDGFRTSHEINKIKTVDINIIKNLVNYDLIEKFRKKSLNTNNIITKGTAENEDIYFSSLMARVPDYENIIKIVSNNMKKINKLMKTEYDLFEYYGKKDAENIIICMGSVSDTIKLVIDNQKDSKYGLVIVRLFRPFSEKHLLASLPKSTKTIAVIDRNKDLTSSPPLYLDVVASLKNNKKIKIISGNYGISSKNTTPSDILSIYHNLESTMQDNFTVSINDDLNNSSLLPIKYDIDLNVKSIKIYGFGSDGMVSASKSILSIIGNTTDDYVQGYFQYDSKKSGGITVSNIRISPNPINAPYYVTNPNIIVVTKDTYLNTLNMFSDAAKNSIVLINTNHKSINDITSNINKENIINKKLKIYLIDAIDIADYYNLNKKISMIMSGIILKMIGTKNSNKLLCEFITNKFMSKSENIVKGNILALKDGQKKVIQDLEVLTTSRTNKKHNIFDMMNKLEGNNIKVSELIPYKDGTFPGGTTKLEKRTISNTAPKWIKENCTTCNLCSLVCPHAVIRPFILDNKSDYYKYGKVLPSTDSRFFISVSPQDCTGCTLCVDACPAKEKALVMQEINLKDQTISNDLFNNHINTYDGEKFNIRNSQFNKPLFEFSGACAGCGETPYIKLLSQLFGNSLIIGNATGCSSIYGASSPNTPYSVPWANSLFEDNAEFTLGMHLSYQNLRNRLIKLIKKEKDTSPNIKKLYDLFLINQNNFEICSKLSNKLSKLKINNEIKQLLPYMTPKTIFAIGGDGWAYDIGFGGLDHILSSNEDINILVLDTEVYSNTGGQASKSTHIGSVAEFANNGKKTIKKDLFKIAMTYPNTYVANVALGANPYQTIKAFKEAVEHKGPSLIIAYSPCIEHGISCGMQNANKEQKLAVEVGYINLMRYNSNDNILIMDSKEPNFERYQELLDNEVRYKALKIKDNKLYNELITLNKESAINRYIYYKNFHK